ncbi:MAG: EamA family transporter [Acidimicrobiia bacterium]|nr:MAG: EamA family transporter [Acidimicrobiia bacterium]
MTDSRATTGALLALLTAALWGITGAMAGGVFDIVPPAYVAQVRAIVTVIVLLPYAVFRGTLKVPAQPWKFMVLGANLALVNVSFYWALDLLGVGPGATIQFLGPIMVLIWMKVARGHPVGSIVWVAAVGAVMGVGLVTEAWALDASDLIGVGAGLISAVTFATYLLYGEYLGASYKPLQIAVWGFIFASVIWIVALPPWTFPSDVPSAAWRDLLIIGVFGTALPFIIEFQALRMVASGIVGVVATAEPAIAAVTAAVLLGQELSAVQWVGVVVVVVAVAAVQRFGLSDLASPAPIA